MKIWVLIPAMNESEFIGNTIDSLMNQSYSNYHISVCINQPKQWWYNDEKRHICLDNENTALYLNKLSTDKITIIDKFSSENGFTIDKSGVGYARKLLADNISTIADYNDILLFTDADTIFDKDYLKNVSDVFNKDKKTLALSAPYYHKLTGNESQDRAILRYEFYMRNYAINMLKIKNPYALTAIGSAICLKSGVYKAIGGITPYKSGEDFYFMQKLIKFGKVSRWCESKVYPAARFSTRVDFGTGPAMIKGDSGDWNSYPIYYQPIFEEIKATFELFDKLFEKDIITPMTGFLQQQFKSEDLWNPLRKNFKTPEKFTRACRQKVDGLRIFQYLRSRQKQMNISENECFKNMLKSVGYENQDINLQSSTCEQLNEVRDWIVNIEDSLLKNHSF